MQAPPLATPRLSPRDIARYERRGYVVLPKFFSDAEIAPLRDACRADPSIGGRLGALADSLGNAQEVIEWTELGDTYLGMVPRLARLVAGAQALIGRPVYHWHSKLSMKAPHSPGRWDWHQDYPYWYAEGCLSPDMLTCMIAIDRVTRQNGCVTLLEGSQRFGRIDHVPIGRANGCDPVRLELLKNRLRLIPVELEPGDACFFHANLLHASGANESDWPRTILHCSYNAADNAPFITAGQEHHRYRPLDVVPDAALLERGWTGVFGQQHFVPLGAPGTADHYGYTVIERSAAQG